MLSLKNISLTFDKGTVNQKNVFENLSLDVNKHDFVTIIGSNGAGKSTLFNVIAGNVITDTGKIFLDDYDITFLPVHKRAKTIGRLFQDPMRGTAPNMTILENLALACLNGGWFSMVKKTDIDFFHKKVAELDMGLENKLNQPVGLLSGGQRQAISLLMATINPPSILLLDEHTAALDPKSADRVMSITNNIIEKKELTCMMVTHNMQQAIDYGNRILMMDAGKIIFDVSGEEKKKLTVQDLLDKFKNLSGSAFDNDRMMLK